MLTGFGLFLVLRPQWLRVVALTSCLTVGLAWGTLGLYVAPVLAGETLAVVAAPDGPGVDYEVVVREGSDGWLDPAWDLTIRQRSGLFAREWTLGCISGDDPHRHDRALLAADSAMQKPTPPTREQVADLWREVASGVTSREAASAWAEPLMFADFPTRPDVLVMQALQYLHGFDMTYRSDDGRFVGHGPPGEYVRTLEQVAEECAAWANRCAAYDADPEGWLADRRREAEEYVRQERLRKS